MPAARSTSETELAQRRALRQFGVGDEDIYAHAGYRDDRARSSSLE